MRFRLRAVTALYALGGDVPDDVRGRLAGAECGEESPAYAFPDTFAVVAAAERVLGMDDVGLRLQIVGLMRNSLAPEAGFTAAYRAHPRDHLVEIVERCRSHRCSGAALAAFRDAVAALRPDDAGTAELRAVVGEAR